MNTHGTLPPVPPPGVYHDQQVRDAQAKTIAWGTEALLTVAGEFIPEMQAARTVLKLADLGFTSVELARFFTAKQAKKLPRELTQGVYERIISYQSKVAGLIDWMAATIEFYDYHDREQAAAAFKAANTREFAIQLVSAEKAMNVSARSFRLLSEVLADVNRELLGRLPHVEGEAERELLFANAVLVYE
ncbi:MAG: hypothetical protein JNL54_12025, partial [Kineosporiaceae bacterium]|nr:hypothetical protein [Kineosporiaceae bacterium]